MNLNLLQIVGAVAIGVVIGGAVLLGLAAFAAAALREAERRDEVQATPKAPGPHPKRVA